LAGWDQELLSASFLRALSSLNAWLISLGVVLDNRLRPITMGDLPDVVPVMPTVVECGALRHAASTALVLRSQASWVRTYNADELDQARRMLDVVTSGVGLASFYELVQRAGSARQAHRDREAVIDYTTAGELFITAMVQAIGERTGMDRKKLRNVLDGPFRDRVMYLCRLLGTPEDPTDAESVVFQWWTHCYRQRNPIVHRGADSEAVLSEMARISLVQLVVDVREKLREDMRLSDIAVGIQWASRIDETGEERHSFPDPIPAAPSN
jgi:hypothetical protein